MTIALGKLQFFSTEIYKGPYMLEKGTPRSASSSLMLSRIVYRQQNGPIQPASATQKTCITNIKMSTPQDSAAETKLPGALSDMRSKK